MRIFSKVAVPIIFLVCLGAGCAKTAPLVNQPVNQAVPTVPTTSTAVPAVDETVSIRFVDQAEQYAIEFPEKLYVQRTSRGTSLVHAIPFSHVNPCDLKDGTVIPLLTDYQLTLSAVPKKGLADWITKRFSPDFTKQVMNKDWFKVDGQTISNITIANRAGVKITQGAEGCGLNTFVLPLTSSTLMIAEQPYGTIVSDLFNGPDAIRARALPGVILPEAANTITDRILASLTTVQATGSIAGFIRPPSSTEIIAYSSENNFSFRYPETWAAQVTPRSYGVDYDIVSPEAEAVSHLFLRSAASIFINAETDGYTVVSEDSPIINDKEWNTAQYQRLPDAPQTEGRVIAIGPHAVREDLGFLVELNYPLGKESVTRTVFDRVLNTLGPRP